MSSTLEISESPESTKGVPRIWRWSVDQYHAMIEAEILKSGDPVELVEGLLFEKATKNSSHAATVRKLARLLGVMVGSAYDIHTQDPIITTFGEPEPDISVVEHDESDYSHGHPTPDQTALVVEVSESTLGFDRTEKLHGYARAGIVEYWIVNLIQRQIEVYMDPDASVEPPTYRQRTVITSAQAIPVTLRAVEFGSVQLAEVLPA
jgi:Uma2 family endonuclease